jgi:hypothetical protein
VADRSREAEAVPSHRVAAEVGPSRPAEEAAVDQNRAGVEVRQPTRCRVRVQQLCFCVGVQAAVLAVHPVVAGLHLQQVRQDREGWQRARSQRKSDRLPGHSLPQREIVH